MPCLDFATKYCKKNLTVNHNSVPYGSITKRWITYSKQSNNWCIIYGRLG